jgi:hypothetical protein
MKNGWMFCLFVIISFSGFGQSTGAFIGWVEQTYNFGEILEGDKVDHIFKFTNTGREPLIITNIEVTCGCTTPKGWPRDPIPPGGDGEFTISFNSAGKLGKVVKVIRVISNATNANNQVTLEAMITEKKSLPN